MDMLTPPAGRSLSPATQPSPAQSWPALHLSVLTHMPPGDEVTAAQVKKRIRLFPGRR